MAGPSIIRAVGSTALEAAMPAPGTRSRNTVGSPAGPAFSSIAQLSHEHTAIRSENGVGWDSEARRNTHIQLRLLLSCYVELQGEAVRSSCACNPFGDIVKSDPITPDDQSGRVVRFRPRGAPPRGGGRWPPAAEQDSPVDDLAKYERTPETSDDYRHRMTMNLLTLLIAAILIAGGVWLSTKLIENRNLQDCFLSGRRNCAPIAVPTRPQD